MAAILPRDLPAADSVNTSAAIIADNGGGNVEKATPLQLVDAATPLATQNEAEVGSNNAKRMTPLRVKQAIDAQAVSLANLSPPTGSTLVGFSHDQAYPSGSIGAKDKNVVSVMDAPFNLKGDGSTVDVAGFNEAVAHVSAGQTLFFPAGDYMFDNSDTQGPLSTLTLPEGVNILMDGGAWLKRKPGGTYNIQAFITCGGYNILQVNIDADEYPGSMTGTWASDSWGIYGEDVSNVIVLNSRLRNMAYGIRPVGARNWKVINCDFYRMKQSAVMFIADADSPAVGNIVQGNTFEDMGDTAVAFLPTMGAEVSFNLIANNIIKNTQHRTLGCSIDWEGGFAFGFIHDNACIGNTVLHSVATSQGQGAITMGLYSSNGLIADNTVICTFINDGTGNSADTAIFIPRNADVAVQGNFIDGYRGGGVIADQSFRVTIRGNTIRNCGDGDGGSGLRSAIVGAWIEGTYGLVVDSNDIAWDNDFIYAGNQVAAVLVARGDAGTTVDNVSITRNRILNPAGHGVRVVGTSGVTVSHVNIIGNEIVGRSGEFAEANPVSLRYGVSCSVKDNIATEVLFGFDLTGSTEVRFTGNELVNNDIATALASWVNITGVTASVFDNNHFDTAQSAKFDPIAQLTTGANNNKARGNRGFVTENGGTTAAGVATGGTIAHGLDVTPNSFSAVATDAAATVTQIAPGASNLTLTFTGGGTPIFAWSARYV